MSQGIIFVCKLIMDKKENSLKISSSLFFFLKNIYYIVEK